MSEKSLDKDYLRRFKKSKWLVILLSSALILGAFRFISINLQSNSLVSENHREKHLVDAGCRMGYCWDTFLLEKRLIHQNNLGGQQNKLYEVDLETENFVDDVNSRSSIDDDSPEMRTNWVYCSFAKPFLAFTSSLDERQDFVYFHLLSPAKKAGIGGYNQGSHAIYWAVCHDQFNVYPFVMTKEAKQLGYSEGLDSYQIELPIELLESVLNQ